MGNGGAGVILGMDRTPPGKDGPIDPVEFTAAMVRGTLRPFFQEANFRWLAWGKADKQRSEFFWR